MMALATTIRRIEHEYPEQGFQEAFLGLLETRVEHTIIAGEAEGRDNRQMIEHFHQMLQQSLDTMKIAEAMKRDP